MTWEVEFCDQSFKFPGSVIGHCNSRASPLYTQRSGKPQHSSLVELPHLSEDPRRKSNEATCFQLPCICTPQPFTPEIFRDSFTIIIAEISRSEPKRKHAKLLANFVQGMSKYWRSCHSVRRPRNEYVLVSGVWLPGVLGKSEIRTIVKPIECRPLNNVYREGNRLPGLSKP